LASAFNFGPALASNRTVAQLVEEIIKHWPGSWQDKSDPRAVHEATLLNLATDKAFHLLHWAPVWSFEQTIARTIQWYRENQSNPDRTPAFTANQIAAYTAEARAQKLAWSAEL
jgi:CDP-glucose 4,6-dehydratase